MFSWSAIHDIGQQHWLHAFASADITDEHLLRGQLPAFSVLTWQTRKAASWLALEIGNHIHSDLVSCIAQCIIYSNNIYVPYFQIKIAPYDASYLIYGFAASQVWMVMMQFIRRRSTFAKSYCIVCLFYLRLYCLWDLLCFPRQHRLQHFTCQSSWLMGT
jgi:hypothetical protein